MANNTSYLFSVYRSSDDRLMVFDGSASDCAKVMGMKLSSFYHLLAVKNGKNGKWTVTKERKTNIEKDING